MNVIWMILVGGVIGLVASMFVKGSRTVGLLWTIILGALGYGVGGLIATSFGGSTLVQWLLGIAITVLLLTGYITLANKRSSTE